MSVRLDSAKQGIIECNPINAAKAANRFGNPHSSLRLMKYTHKMRWDNKLNKVKLD